MSTPASPPGRVRRRPRAEIRAAVMDAAITLFAQHGYGGTSLEQVAAAAGLTRGAVYSNFTGKEELLLALLGETVAQRIERIARAVAPTQTLREQTRQIGEVMIGELRDGPERHLLFVQFWLKAVHDPDARAFLNAHREECCVVVATALEEHAARWGFELSLPAADLALGLVSLFNGFGLEHLVDPETATPELFDRLVTALVLPRSGL
ncbi:TetR/AcrR family transcriptional regulator [Spirillospora sp. CA-142024]|uniref:TetR/AcrR family transcriptional regulator n=1 Tax=Spirillospora sp. CA-142024 TaxID=3240036 RepID=UPI003D93C04A